MPARRRAGRACSSAAAGRPAARPPTGPGRRRLRAYVRDTDADALRAQLGAGAPELAQIVPELRAPLPRSAAAVPARAGGCALSPVRRDGRVPSRRRASQRPIVLVLDDLHAADAPSLLLLRFLARELGSTRVLRSRRLPGCRPGRRRQPLTEMLAEVGREPVTRRLPLGVSASPRSPSYVELTASEIASPRARGARCTRRPREIRCSSARSCACSRSKELSRNRPTRSRLAIPQTVRDVIARRLGHLSDECDRLLVLASVLGREFALDTLGRLGGVTDDELLDGLDEAIDARVVSDVPGGLPGAFASRTC